MKKGNAYEVAKRLVKGLSAQSQNVMRQTLIHKLVKKGYSMEVATRVGQSIELNLDEQKALQDALKKAHVYMLQKVAMNNFREFVYIV